MPTEINESKTKNQARQPFYAFTRVTWRGTTRVNRGLKIMGISFNPMDGRIIRLKLDPESASDLRDSLYEYLTDYERSQSAGSSGSPSVLGSTVPGQLNATAKEIVESLLYTLFICEDGTMGLTIFDVDDTATINLGKDMAKGLVENINHYIELLK
jgi:hypothetical protein